MQRRKPPASQAERTLIAGKLTNTRDNLVLWIRNPKAFKPLTAMPDMGVSEADARDMQAYLVTLHWLDHAVACTQLL